MKLMVLGVAAVMALVPMAARAQEQRPDTTVEQKASPVKAVKPVYLNKGMVEGLLSLMQAEGNGSFAFNEALGQAAMSRREYVARKNALFIAKLDAAYESRLLAIQGDANAFKVRKSNVQLYLLDQTRLDQTLLRVQPDPSCGACTP